MTPYVIVATRGRPRELRELILGLARQTIAPKQIFVVGVSEEDVATVRGVTLDGIEFSVHLAQKPGLTRQRNEPLRWLREAGKLDAPSFVAFFDDDFRPAANWLAEAARIFTEEPAIAGLTGRVLADGVNRQGLSEEDAAAIIAGTQAPLPNWANVETRVEVESVYGCNMAFRNHVMKACLFDEDLPLYGWQEDRDMTGQAKRFGSVILTPTCLGVHMGSQGARSSGLRLGYSQIANLTYLARKGTIDRATMLRFTCRALASNSLRSIHTRRDVDYRGRLRGNLRALGDLLRGKAHPLNVLDL